MKVKGRDVWSREVWDRGRGRARRADDEWSVETRQEERRKQRQLTEERERRMGGKEQGLPSTGWSLVN